MTTLIRTLTAVAIAAVASITATPASAACQAGVCSLPAPAAPAPPPAGCKVDDATVKASLPRLLAQEGLAAAAPFPLVTRIELDNDMSTSEGLVTVIAPELCHPGLACETLIVSCRGGQLVSLGHGIAIKRLHSASRGWADLGLQRPSIIPFFFEVSRVLRWTGARYQ